MEASAINQINAGDNTFNIGNLFAGSGSNSVTNISDISNTSNPIPGGGINPFAGEGGSQLQQLIFNRLQLVLGEDFFKDIDNALASGGNPFAGGDSNLFTNGGSSFQSPFDPLQIVLGNQTPFSDNSNSITDSPPFNKDNAPVGNGNRDFGNNNATIGNFNSDYGSDSATVGNGNWNFNNNNTTVGNGNWLFAENNTTLGNGNWYWDDGSNNATLGNGNWHFGNDNATIGNGNWDFGSNNTIVGNGNWLFTSNNTVVGNGNWLSTNDNTIIGNGSNTNILESSPQEIRSDVDNLINSFIGKIGQDFLELTENFDVSQTQTFNRLILSRDTDTNFNTNIEQLLASLSSHYQPVQPQSVPEPTSSVSLVVVGLACLVLSKLKKNLQNN
ncbi:hypothetical protein [Halotia branconii]|uniref:Uncharacterized protein n=1 Tax=Halotia branconii CENA392 TaxID=1539056 RepID=A0AAJ6NPA2_9CYAN|nr:hypothetical protein [Halotia branconii]WGV24051.1 hypothetical protein QI031_19885 [Halotia branconii CENA392]